MKHTPSSFQHKRGHKREEEKKFLLLFNFSWRKKKGDPSSFQKDVREKLWWWTECVISISSSFVDTRELLFNWAGRLVLFLFSSSRQLQQMDVTFGRSDGKKIYFERKKNKTEYFRFISSLVKKNFPYWSVVSRPFVFRAPTFSPFRDSSVTSLKIDVKSWPQNRESIELEIW